MPSPLDHLRTLGTWERIWLAVRLAMVALFAVSGAREPRPPLDVAIEMFRQTPWMVPANLVVAPLLTLVVVGVQSINPLGAAIWLPPSWTRPPLSPRQPLQIPHAVSFPIVAYGVVAAIRIAATGRPTGELLFPAYVVCSGIGFWLGARLCTRVFRRKLAPRPA